MKKFHQFWHAFRECHYFKRRAFLRHDTYQFFFSILLKIYEGCALYNKKKVSGDLSRAKFDCVVMASFQWCTFDEKANIFLAKF